MTAVAVEPQENPLEEGLLLRRTPDPCAIVIFGASGDLAHKKLMPALYALMFRRLLPPRFAIVGVARTEGDDDAFRDDMKDAVQKHARDEFRQETWDELAQNMHYVATDFSDEG
jgi:glucose-6-phosphate 1-dehydrogenase